MKVRVEPFQLRLPIDTHRSPGLHLSTILRDLALRTGILDSKYEVQEDMDDNVIVHCGMAWEDYIAKNLHPDLEYHPGELNLDGIAMSPDAIGIVDNEDYADRMGVELDSWILSEFKFTRKSSRDFKELLRLKSPKVRLWLWQIMAYRYALNKICEPGTECYIAKLHVLFVSGNYKWDDKDPESKPTYRIFILEFEPEELESNWAVIKSHAQSFKEVG